MRDELVEASKLLEKAWGGGIHYEEASRIAKEANSLLSNIDPDSLNDLELVNFLRVLNGSFDNERGYQIAIQKCQNSSNKDLIGVIDALSQCAFFHDGDEYPEKMEELIELCIGEPAQWLINKAEWLQLVATGEKFEEMEWCKGDPIKDFAALKQASITLEKAVSHGAFNSCYFDEYNPEEWEVDTWQEVWDEIWAPILSSQEYICLNSTNLANKSPNKKLHRTP